MADVKVIGLQETIEKFRQLGQTIVPEAADKALKSSAQIMRKAIQNAAPIRLEPKFRKYGPIRKSVFAKKITEGLTQMIEQITYTVGITRKAFYAWFIEKGYAIGGIRERSRAGGKSVTKHTGKGVTHIAARPFFRPTVDAMENHIYAEIEKTIQAELNKLQS